MVTEKDIYELVRDLVIEVRENQEQSMKRFSKIDERMEKIMRKLNEIDKTSSETNEIVSNGFSDAA